MNNYLQLVVKRNTRSKKKNIFLLISIIISVFLITSVFATAEMAINSQIKLQKKTYGDYHVILRNINDDIAQKVSNRPDVELSGWLFQGGSGFLGNKEVSFLGAKKEIASMNTIDIKEGYYPVKNNEIALNEGALGELNKKIGDQISVKILSQEVGFKITGIYPDTAAIQKANVYGAVVSENTFRNLHFPSSDVDAGYRIKFKDSVEIHSSIENLKKEFHLNNKNISENTILLGALGQSSNKIIKQFYLVVFFIAALVIFAGSFMIISALNLQVLENVSYYGTLRGIGSSKKQIKLLVFCEAIYIALKTIPLGLLFGQLSSWLICFILKKTNGSFFSEISLFHINFRSLCIASILGLVMVLIASFSPAIIAAKIQPIVAIKGNNVANKYSGPIVSRFSIDADLGIRYALKRKKNIFLLTGSFALCIILIFSFQCILNFFNIAMPTMNAMTSDIAILSNPEAKITISQIEALKDVKGIKSVYANKETDDFLLNGQRTDYKIISIDDFQRKVLSRDVIEGDIKDIFHKNNSFICIEDSTAKYKIGDTLNIKTNLTDQKINICTSISTFRRNGVSKDNKNYLICSQSTYDSLFPNSQYSYLGLQTDKETDSNLINKIKKEVPPSVQTLDFRSANSEQRDTYNTIMIFLYGFLTLITLISFFNIINTMNVSVLSKLKLIGRLQAIGMSKIQYSKMILTESMLYVFNGLIVGIILGTLLHKALFQYLITERWGIVWEVPIKMIFLVFFMCILAATISVIYPIKKINKTNIVNLLHDS